MHDDKNNEHGGDNTLVAFIAVGDIASVTLIFSFSCFDFPQYTISPFNYNMLVGPSVDFFSKY